MYRALRYWLMLPPSPAPWPLKGPRPSPLTSLERFFFSLWLRTYHLANFNSHTKQRDPFCLHSKWCQPGSKESLGPAAGQGYNPPNLQSPASCVLQLVLPAKNSTASPNLQVLNLHEAVETSAALRDTWDLFPPVVLGGDKSSVRGSKPHCRH